MDRYNRIRSLKGSAAGTYKKLEVMEGSETSPKAHTGMMSITGQALQEQQLDKRLDVKQTRFGGEDDEEKR